MIADTFDQLCAFAGTWQGEGRGRFPTIDDFRYEERLQLVADDAYPLLAYEQRTWLEDGEPGHWESGFWRPGPGGVVEISNAQESGRVEVLSGRVRQTDAGTEVVLNSVVHGHDARLIRTRRTLHLTEDSLSYVVEMATHTTEQPVLLRHLTARLERIAGAGDPAGRSSRSSPAVL